MNLSLIFLSSYSVIVVLVREETLVPVKSSRENTWKQLISVSRVNEQVAKVSGLVLTGSMKWR